MQNYEKKIVLLYNYVVHKYQCSSIDRIFIIFFLGH